MNQQRAYRYDFRQEVSYYVDPAGAEDLRSGMIVNLSRAGLCLCIPQPLAVGQRLIVRTEKMDIKGIVVWCAESADVHSPHAFRAGMQFIIEK